MRGILPFRPVPTRPQPWLWPRSCTCWGLSSTRLRWWRFYALGVWPVIEAGHHAERDLRRGAGVGCMAGVRCGPCAVGYFSAAACWCAGRPGRPGRHGDGVVVGAAVHGRPPGTGAALPRHCSLNLCMQGAQARPLALISGRLPIIEGFAFAPWSITPLHLPCLSMPTNAVPAATPGMYCKKCLPTP